MNAKQANYTANSYNEKNNSAEIIGVKDWETKRKRIKVENYLEMKYKNLA